MSAMAETRSRRPRRRFTDEFKQQAVRLVLNEGKSVTAVARELDLVPSALGQWVKQAQADRSKGRTGLTTAEREELVRDAFYASPKFPRLLKPEAVKDTISRGLDAGLIAYVGRGPDGRYDPFVFSRSLAAADIEISDDTFLIRKEDAETYLKGLQDPVPSPVPHPSAPNQGAKLDPPERPPEQSKTISGFAWSGTVAHQKWMNFYTKGLSRFANSGGLNISVTIDVAPPGGVSASAVEETKTALRELGAADDLRFKD